MPSYSIETSKLTPPIREREHELLPSSTLMILDICNLASADHSNSDLLLTLVEEFGALDVVRKEEECSNNEKQAWQTFDEK